MMISKNPLGDIAKLNRICASAQIGWWEVNFTTGKCFISETLLKSLEVSSEWLDIDELMSTVRQDYRKRITDEFTSIPRKGVFEQTFPVTSGRGNVFWIHCALSMEEENEEGQLIATGYGQRIESPETQGYQCAWNQRINNLLYCQNSIANSLLKLLSNDTGDELFEEMLADILYFFKGARVYIVRYNWKNGNQSCLYEVAACNVITLKEKLQNICSEDAPWFYQQIHANRPVILNSPDELPPLAVRDREVLAENGTNSMMLAPLMREEGVWGYMGIDIVDGYRKWNSEDYQWFSSLANIISICMELRIESPNMTRDIHESLRAGRPGTFHLKYDFDEERRLFQSERRGVMDLDIRSLMLYDAEDNLSNYLLVNIDNTERNNALSKVHDFENFFSIISDYSKVGYAKINLLDHTGFAVRQWYRNLGESHDTPLADIIGIFSHMHPDDRKSVLDFYEKAKAGTERFFDGDLRIRPADGSDRWNWIHKSSMVTAYQSPNPRLELVEVNYDITVQKETEAELRAARDKAEESNRLKSAFLANISHEIRTPLNAIVGFSDLLMTVDDPAEQEEFRRTIQKNNTLLLQLFSDIIDLSKIDAGSFEYMPKPVCLYQFCAMMVQKMRNKVPEGVELQIDEDSPLDAWFSADSGYLNQVVTNFMSNAIKFTHRGTITVGYRIDARQQLEMFVEDTGIGISIENQEAVFDRFMKVDSFVQGTGLGLPLCKSIIEKMGGHIGVISELGKGSRFWFTLPAFSCIPTR
ncbi:his Kinase A domain protein [Bacteroides fragilis str. 3998T(B)3]|uniref:histidine kinase n=1 Tax=Bacteroides fragilis str. 3998T(B)3 TaxID=1339316 RepID=A0A015U0Y4_BACFG|nr:ATP-binding protein [Bacteroides fragilis]EXY90344.1 his Kinase A domain protein [Bacteroides fragilis str. 3998T(B)3]EXY95230.1 his Kinase A domain protein [Bacteroides fragilis str. 3998 T(B) 4]